MRRRDFLAAGAAATASPLLHPAAGLAGEPAGSPGRPVAADASRPAPVRTWTIGGSRYVIRLDGTALTCDCYDADEPVPAADAPALPLPPPGSLGDPTLVALGPAHRPVAWRLEAWQQPDPSTVVARLAAEGSPLRAEATFAFDRRSRLVQRRTVLHHAGDEGEIDIRATLGFWMRIHEPIRWMVHLSGAWGEEAQIQHGAPGDQPLVLESRAGKTGFEFQPYLMLRTPTATHVLQLFWSGNWTIRALPEPAGPVLLGGFNNWGFRHRLLPGASLALPAVLFGRVEGGVNAATQRLHDWRRAHRPDPDHPIPVQFNSWYPYFDDPSEANMLPLVPVARKLGCESFVVDAGWYRTEDEDDGDINWQLRTGDWRVSRARFPQGLSHLSRACREQGLTFGLWFEPETLGPRSALRREHPEWLHHIGGVPPKPEARAVLNLGVPQAWDHVYARVTRLLGAIGVGWMKWDFNVDIGAGGWAPGLPEALVAEDPLVAHYEGLYRMEDALRAAFPEMILEMCAGGGGRMDAEILSHAHVNWISDQPAPLRKLAIHFGSQLAHPAVVCNDWLIEWPPVAPPPPGTKPGAEPPPMPGIDDRGDLAFRLRVAMLGSFGFSAHVDRWPADEFEVAATHARLYAGELRAIIHHGDQYFLTLPPTPEGEGDWAAIWYLAKDRRKGVLFAFCLTDPDLRRTFRLPGLAAGRHYRVRLVSAEEERVMTGAQLRTGLPLAVPEHYRSELCIVEAA